MERREAEEASQLMEEEVVEMASGEEVEPRRVEGGGRTNSGIWGDMEAAPVRGGGTGSARSPRRRPARRRKGYSSRWRARGSGAGGS
ncbi:hypothetical protein E2562_010075 [Oryza meyeriana var. granulata]|uniref:Uncharacterized protein n=1 Tax=Oryza meyeriana var. granulata TaxID=110450 RepID=A0A6G1EI43_9ORYZ|nr:hypothetical protein E2562_010075 [Oryza meyeriana var. granulata]